MDALIDAQGAIGLARALVIPMYNEEARIAASLQAIAASSLAESDLELVLVDDGSDDRTAAVAADVAASLGLRARVLQLGTNQGKGAAVRAGMLAATARTRVFVDADLSVDVKDLIRCFEVLEQGGADVAYGTRAHPDSSMARSQPPHRVASGRIYNVLLRRLSLTEERDTQCGMKGFTAASAEGIFAPMATAGFGFDVEVLARAVRGGWRTIDLPVTWSHVGASRVRPVRDGVRMGLGAVRIQVRLRREERHGSGGGSMAAESFDAMGRVEDEHWWFRAKRALVTDQIRRYRAGDGLGVDVGCGTGALVRELGTARPVVGIELDLTALGLAAGRTEAGLVRGSAAHVPVRSGSASVVTALDVVEHLDDDVAALRELARVAGDGLVVVAVPAYAWAWSDHDVALGHRRRYTRRSLREVADAADLEVLRVSHFHSWLTPVAVVVRRTPVRHLLRSSAEEASFVHPSVNRLLVRVTAVERALLRRMDLPFGLSVLLVARARPSSPIAEA